MKNIHLTFITLLLLVLLSCTALSCGSDDSTPTNSYHFLDQNLQGIIDGQTFVFGEGTADSSSFNEGKFSIELYHADENILELCDFFGFGNKVSVFFEIPDDVGLFELSFDLNTFDGQTVTLFNPDGVQNNIATMGAVEILSITDSLIMGRMDARMDAENSINGNFTAIFCSN